MADLLTNISFAAFFSFLIVWLIRDTVRDFTKNSSQSVEDATPKTKKKGL
jgi:hypothetical protein